MDYLASGAFTKHYDTSPSFLPDSHPTVAAAAAAGGEENASDDEWRCKLGGVLLSSLPR